mgnify:CR=1 FL=1
MCVLHIEYLYGYMQPHKVWTRVTILLQEKLFRKFPESIHKFPNGKISGENFREFPENVGKIPDGKISGENFREIPGNSGKFRENSRRENFRGNFRGKFRENLFSRQPNL